MRDSQLLKQAQWYDWPEIFIVGCLEYKRLQKMDRTREVKQSANKNIGWETALTPH